MKQGIIVVNHGTVNLQAKQRTIDEFVLSIGDRMEDAEITCAYTDSNVRKAFREITGEKLQNVKAAMLSMKEAGVTDLLIVTTDIIEDDSHISLREEVSSVAALFKNVRISKPLLSSEADAEITARAFYGAFGSIVAEDRLILVAEGVKGEGVTELEAFKAAMKKILPKSHVATLKGEDRLYKVIKELQKAGENEGRIVLVPLEFVAGEEIENELSREYSNLVEKLESSGYTVETLFKGLGEYDEFQRLYLRHAYSA
ncbi:MAG: sirohydrochlorin cobaltochelatase [Eubacterium sp.]|nr:sirohydrochlorin cobaltochelatase [Eubacterium sp.]